MLTKWRLGVVLAALGLAGPVQAQAPPAVPGAPALPGGPVPPAAAGAAGAGTAGAAGAGGAAPKNIWSFFMKTPEQKAQCKAHFCNSRVGQLVNNMLLPAGTMTGGMLGPICPGPETPNPADLAKPASSAQGAAAKIKAEEAQAGAKIAAIEYLATVDCRYYPEAEAALIAGLRAEKNECVRLAAAKALASGCCCSAKVVKALTISVNCSNKDGFPAEASELVRTYAYVALERCLRKCVEAEPEAPPEPPAAAKKAMYESLAPIGTIPDYTAAILLSAYYSLEKTETPAALFASARVTLSRGLSISPNTVARLSGPRNVRDSMLSDGARTQLQVDVASRQAPSEQPRLPVTISFATSEPPLQPARQYEMEVAGPLEPGQPIAVTRVQPERKPGRGNLLNLVQDAWRK